VSALGQFDASLVRIIGRCWLRLTPTARRWLAYELQRRVREGN
jgi:hypothetical protein